MVNGAYGTMVDTPETGLTAEQAAKRLAEIGPNDIGHGAAKVSPLRIFLRQFQGLLVYILIAAAVIAAMLGEMIDCIAILLVIVLNGVLGFLQEWRAEAAIEALRNMLAPMATVIRDGRQQDLPARDIVPGDLLALAAGQKVPADLELRTASGLRVDESVLTGESVPVDRMPGPEAGAVSMGTLVVGGRGRGVVTATGARTRFGQIADLTGSVGQKSTRLQRELAVLARQLGIFGIAVAAVIVLVGLAVGHDLFDMLMTGLSMAVAVVPEGLPAVVTLTLALGASAMVREKALLRRLQAMETLGAASVICTDKTGTLTENRMTAVRVVTHSRHFTVSGTGYDPDGRIEADGTPVHAGEDVELRALLCTGAICNDATLTLDAGTWTMIGDPTEGALQTLARKGDAVPEPASRLGEVPFSSERKRMAVLTPGDDGPMLHLKGAPEAVLQVSTQIYRNGELRPLDPVTREHLRAQYEDMASDGLRVIGLAQRRAEGDSDLSETGMTFLGFAALLDPPRPEVAEAVALCKRAGIRVIMITGDGAATAAAIARELGIGQTRAVTGPQLEKMSDDDLARLLDEDVVFARTAPAHKMRIVKQLQAKGAIVAMTGDGVNDAPALKQADIGVAMGQRGTDVAKDAADLVVLDDNFATIVRAIREGRRQFSNIRKFVRYLLASNTGEVLALAVNLLIGGPLIFFPIHILWINLVTDSASAIALGLERAEPGLMDRPPIKASDRILTRDGVTHFAGFGIYMAAAALGVFYITLPEGADLARTAAFSTMVLAELLAVFAFRSRDEPAFRLGWFSNRGLTAAVAGMALLQGLAIYWPPLQVLLKTVPLDGWHLGLVVLATLPLLVVPTLTKLLRQRLGTAAA